MKTELHLPFALSIALSTTTACAQLVFVPDVDFRAALNAWMPGVVDVNGYIDTQNPDVASVDTMGVSGAWYGTGFSIDWPNADLTGLEAFSDLHEIGFDGIDGAVVIGSWPPNLWELGIRDCMISSLPPFPPSTYLLDLNNVAGLSQLPTLPALMYQLGVINCPDFTDLPPLPPGLAVLGLADLPLFSTIPPLPIGLEHLSLEELPLLTTDPQLPNTLLNLYLRELPGLLSLPDYSAINLEELTLFGFTQDSLPPWPASLLGLSLWDLPFVESLPPFPPLFNYLDIADMPVLHCLPALPDTMVSFLLDDYAVNWGLPPTTDIGCLPNIPIITDYGSIFFNGVTYPVDQSDVCNALDSACSSANAAVLGTTYWDQNSNGALDIGESGLPGIQLVATPGAYVSGSLANGTYELSLQPAAYVLTPVYYYPYVASITPPSIAIAPQSNTDVLPGNDFGITFMPNVQDLIAYFSSTEARPGFNTTCWVGYLNYGTQVQDGSVSFTIDPQLSFVSSTVPPDVVNGNTLTWNFTQLQLGEYRSIGLVLNTWSGASLGSVISHAVVVDPLATDQTPLDNAIAYADSVVGSYDPNDKQVEPAQLTPAQVAAGERVNYTIHFQNTGTYPAERVVITDTLSSDLQWSTMHLIASSHANTWYISNGVLHVIFDSIMLPDSVSDEPASHGFVKFSMQPAGTLGLGSVVDNIANIYFDYNEPVITNAAAFIVEDLVGMADVDGNDVRVFPNPASDMLTVVSKAAFTNAPIEIIDVTGRTVLRGAVSGQRTTLDIAHLTAGVYQLRIEEHGAMRIVKQ
ncbi:MAG: T9SS type A sorting domain-containing protein [Flavobacteriales bacterium]